MRNFNKTIAVLSLFVPTSVYPLGIGEIKMHSALNQNLDAEISLLISKGEDVSDIRVKLAPPEKFDEAGVAWSYFLSKIKFEAVKLRSGSTIVKLSSDEILREPFLDFLLEVSWPQGNLYREFTVLVDPPASYTQPVVPIIEKVEQKAQLQPSSNQFRQAKPIVVEPLVNQSVSSQYGPTNRSDSLWKVAEKTNAYGDVSIEQMMMAIYKANPNAFYKDNVNALKANQVLEIPEKEMLLKLSRKQALRAFKKQNDVWNGRVKKKKTDLANNAATDADKVKVSNQLELEAPLESEINDSVVAVSDTKTTVNEVANSVAKNGVVVASGEEVLSLQSRMEKLEQQLEMMQKMLVLKDEQIAALQNQKKTELSQDISPNQQKPAKSIAEIKKEASDNKQLNTEKLPKNNQTDNLTSKTIEKAQVKSVDKKSIADKKKVKTKSKAKPVKIQQEPETGFMSSLFAQIMAAMGFIILGLLGWFLWNKRKEDELTETESMFASASEISLPDSAIEDSSIPVADEVSYDVGTVGESSFLSEFTPSDFDAFDTEQDEIDPISEADVYLAYGRYQQAEDLIRKAISDHPERNECKLKLLEIFYASENKIAFQEYAEELVSSDKHKEHEFWSKVIEMGSELIPGNVLFTEEAGGKASFETGGLVDHVDSIFEEKVLEETVQTEITEEEPTISLDDGGILNIPDLESSNENENEMEFDMSAFEEKTDIAQTEEDTGLDFDLSVFEMDESEVEKIEDEKPIDKEVESIDFDFTDIGVDPSKKNNESEQEIEDIDDSNLDFDLSIFDKDNTDNEQISKEKKDSEVDNINTDAIALDDEVLDTVDFSSEIKADDSLDNFDFSLENVTSEIDNLDSAVIDQKPKENGSIAEFDFDTPDPASDTLKIKDADVSDLTDMDELETKMDLAKAYLDMGDTGSAKKIAEEVLEKGSENQKKVAQGILDQTS